METKAIDYRMQDLSEDLIHMGAQRITSEDGTEKVIIEDHFHTDDLRLIYKAAHGYGLTARLGMERKRNGVEALFIEVVH